WQAVPAASPDAGRTPSGAPCAGRFPTLSKKEGGAREKRMSDPRIVTNADRARDIEPPLREFAARTGLDIAPEPDGDGPATVAGDMICNILHWVAINSEHGQLDALRAIRSGIGHFASESAIDYGADIVDELGPDAHVSIEVLCDGEIWTSETGSDPEIESPEVETAEP